MPLIHSSKKAAFKKNVETEMKAHPDKKAQDLAIAYSVQKEARRKKKASGGTVKSGSSDMNMAEGGSISASNEKRPMPNDLHDDAVMANHNKTKKALMNSDWTDNPTVAQAQKNNGREVLPIKRPKMVPTNAFSTRLYDEEGKLQDSASPGPYGKQPPKQDDEDGSNRQGPRIPDMEDEHSTHKKPYKMETEDDDTTDESQADMRRPKGGYAKGGEVESEDYDHKAQNKYESSLTGLTPSEDEGEMMADEHNEMDADMEGNSPDMEDEHSTSRKPYAGGGKIGDTEENIDDTVGGEEPATHGWSMDDSEDQPMEEEKEEHHNSIAAAIMARKRAKEAQHAAKMSDSDIDEMMMLYEGGEITRKSDKILSHDSIYSDDSDTTDLRRNAQEDANEEDQLSFNALRKENYSTDYMDRNQPTDSNEHGDSEESDSEDKHDMVSAIRRKMKSKKQF